MGFPEWASENSFYDNLTNWEPREEDIFSAYKEIMDLEFPDRQILEKAMIGDEKWLICHLCMDAWEQSSCSDGMVRCPKCKNIMHNPRYKDELPHR